MLNRRREMRYIVSEIYDNFMVCKIKEPTGEYNPVKLLNVSLSGIRMKSEFKLPVGSLIECLISVPKAPTKDILFGVKITHCIEGEQGKVYIMGGEVIIHDAINLVQFVVPGLTRNPVFSWIPAFAEILVR